MGLQRLTTVEFNSSRPIHRTGSLTKEVDTAYKPGSTEKKYYFDKNSREVFDHKPLSFSKREWAFYIVDSDEIVEMKGLRKTLTELDNSCSLKICINYSARILQNPQKELIKLLIEEQDSEKAINDRIVRWISGFATNEPEFVKRFFSLQAQLKQHIEDEARKLGLYLDLAIDDGENTDDLIVSGKIDIKVKDYSHRIPLSFELEVSIIEDKKIAGMQFLTNKTKLDTRVKEIIKKTINSKNTIDLHYFYYNLQKGLRELLIRELDIELDRDGLKPEFLILESQLINPPPERSKLKHSVNCITNNSYDIDIEHRIILTLKNLGDFYNSGIKDINQWVKDELDRITQDYIIEKKFTELALYFDSSSIKAEMAKSVAQNGYEIKQLITVPNLDGIVPDNFNFEVGKDIDFLTEKEDVRVRLNVIANGKIEDPKEKIAKYINPDTTRDGIIKKIKETVINTVRQYIHKIDPKEFYMKFNTPFEDQGKSPADKLISNITKKLEQEFGASDVDIILKQLETDLIKKFKALLGVDHSINIEIQGLQAKFDAQFMVSNVHGESYDLFKAKCDAYNNKDILTMLEDIAKVIKHNVELHLNKIRDLDEEIINTDDFFKHIMGLLDASKKTVVKIFGLEIKIAPLLRKHPTVYEEIQKAKVLEDKIRAINDIKRIGSYEERKLEKVIKSKEEGIELSYTEKEIDKLIEDRNNEISPKRNAPKKVILPEIIELSPPETKNLESKPNEEDTNK